MKIFPLNLRAYTASPLLMNSLTTHFTDSIVEVSLAVIVPCLLLYTWYKVKIKKNIFTYIKCYRSYIFPCEQLNYQYD